MEEGGYVLVGVLLGMSYWDGMAKDLDYLNELARHGSREVALKRANKRVEE